MVSIYLQKKTVLLMRRVQLMKKNLWAFLENDFLKLHFSNKNLNYKITFKDMHVHSADSDQKQSFTKWKELY